MHHVFHDFFCLKTTTSTIGCYLLLSCGLYFFALLWFYCFLFRFVICLWFVEATGGVKRTVMKCRRKQRKGHRNVTGCLPAAPSASAHGIWWVSPNLVNFKKVMFEKSRRIIVNSHIHFSMVSKMSEFLFDYTLHIWSICSKVNWYYVISVLENLILLYHHDKMNQKQTFGHSIWHILKPFQEWYFTYRGHT